MAKEFTDANFNEKVLNYNGLSVVDFWAEWCGPCRIVGPIIDELSKEYEEKANIGKLNVDFNSDIPTRYGITGIPAILFFKNGQMVDKIVGVQSKQNFIKKIDELL